MNKIAASKPVQFFAGIGMMAVGFASAAFPSVASAATGTGITGGINDATNGTDLQGQADLVGIVSTITNVLLYIVGVVAVIMLIIGGLRYILSNGDSKNVEAAKNTILYAVVGIIVALLALAIVNFVVGRIRGQ